MTSASQFSDQSQQNPPLTDIEELTISFVIKNLNPTLLSYDFLNMSGIVPSDWELAKQPITNQRGSQVSFKNGVNIIAQPNSVSFIEGLGAKEVKDLQFANIAKKYVDKMSNAEYQGVSISPKIIVPFSQDEEGGKNFINDTLLNKGLWRDFENVTPQASLNLFYELNDRQLALNINPAKLQQSNDISISAVLFAGNFNYNLSNLVGENRLNKITQIIGTWSQDLQTFRELIYQKFLQKAVAEKASLFES
ncbi:hypothetical protein GM3708_3245 [Geminocystis sp. NIES-3708]|uniref:hypothetical protein n=1 Tax=Geminocystis sp. NIES-3708 TaxID=1615909 RepID=UPI0005FCB7F0|nr:hypothetical protein [Geminocystis sp. NIES-3708]BAQ62839.1 hypothetical protein GM3708_3245 [Geminocystis sp. NIES-3708]